MWESGLGTAARTGLERPAMGEQQTLAVSGVCTPGHWTEPLVIDTDRQKIVSMEKNKILDFYASVIIILKLRYEWDIGITRR